MCQKHFVALRLCIYWLIINALILQSQSHWPLLYIQKPQHNTSTHTHTQFLISSNNKDDLNELMLFLLCLLNNIFLISTFLLPQMHFNIWVVGEILRWLPWESRWRIYGKKNLGLQGNSNYAGLLLREEQRPVRGHIRSLLFIIPLFTSTLHKM